MRLRVPRQHCRRCYGCEGAASAAEEQPSRRQIHPRLVDMRRCLRQLGIRRALVW
jgi:hypothetical protein